jgi:hypothetical protein
LPTPAPIAIWNPDLNVTPSSPTLPYADLPARCGIGVERTATSLRVVIPPAPSIKDLPPGLLFGTVAMVAFVVMLLAMGHYNWRVSGDDFAGFFAGVGFYGGALVLLGRACWVRLSRRIVIDIDPRRFCLRHVTRRGRIISEGCWPRHQIGHAKYNVSNGKMVVRIIGIDMLDVPISGQRQITEWVAGVIDNALRQLPATAPTYAPAAPALPRA